MTQQTTKNTTETVAGQGTPTSDWVERPVGLSATGGTVSHSPAYEQARHRAERKRKFRADLVSYVVINAFLVLVWALTGFGYFWPGWVIGAWGVFVILAAWDLYFRHDLTEEDIERELRRAR